MKKTTISLIALMFLLSNPGLYVMPSASASRGIDLAVTRVFWGTNPVSPLTAHPGDENLPLSIVLANVGDTSAWKINATLLLIPPFSYEYISDGKIRSVNNISTFTGASMPKETVTLHYTLNIDPYAKPGVYRLDLKLGYETLTEIAITSTKFVDAPVSPGYVRPQRIEITPRTVYPDDDQANLKVWIINPTSTAKDLNVKLQLEYPFKPSWSSSDRAFLGSLQPGQVSEANFYLDIDENAVPQDHSLTLLIEHGTHNRSFSVPFLVSKKASFEIIRVSPIEMRVGEKKVVIKVLLRNVGGSDAEAVRVQLLGGNEITGSTVDYVGLIKSGELRTVTFTVDVDSSASVGSRRVEVDAFWVQEGRSFSQRLHRDLTILESRGFPIVGIVAVLALIAVGIAVVWLVRRRRKEKGQRSDE